MPSSISLPPHGPSHFKWKISTGRMSRSRCGVPSMGAMNRLSPELRAIVIGAGGETLVQMDLEADPSVEGGFRRRLPTLEPGTYQLRIERTGVEPAGDSFAVAGVTEPP